VRWLFVAGLSLELAGALLIAAGVTSRTPAENREEATSHLDANLWIIVFREREQRLVRTGLFVLGTGFLLQLAGYLWSFDGGMIIGGVAVVAAVLTAGFFGGRRIAASAAPLTYHSDLTLPAGIQDERHGHALADLEEVKKWRQLYCERLLGKEPRRVNEPVLHPNINHGRWLVECPRCRGSVTLATPGLDTIICPGSCGLEYPVTFPDDREQIEEILLLRPVENRHWTSESLGELRAENVAHGVPVPDCRWPSEV
jgi:hypothetical protein